MAQKKCNLMILMTSYDFRLMPFWICKLGGTD